LDRRAREDQDGEDTTVSTVRARLSRSEKLMPAISVKDLCKSYGELHAVDSVSFRVERGEVFALLGPNGAGKTTTIEILEGFLLRDGGDVQVLGVDPGHRRQQRWLRTRIGVVLQELAVEPFFTVRQVLERNSGFYPAPRPVEEVIELVGLSEKAGTKIKRLSGGQQRRLDIGLGIIGNPELLFLDEPTTGLDPAARRTTWDLIRTLASDGTTVVLSSHYMDEVEALAQGVAVLARGRIVATGSPSSIGGRDRGQVTIRFTLPDDVGPADLPVAPSHLDGNVVEISTNDELVVLARIVNWALESHRALPGLSVTRVTLEDVYLDLTRPIHDGPGH
jgi:ABC-2 type transport system ATP-binding protein